LDGLTEWPEAVRTMQRNWIGRSEGARVRFPVEGTGESLEVFTTRIDTIYGATFLVVSPEHPLLGRLAAGAERAEEVASFVGRAREAARASRFVETEKSGVATGLFAKNPFSGERVPVWVANYVVMEYGTGAIMAVPAHDERDLEFAKRYGLPIRQVIRPAGEETPQAGALPSAGDGPYTDDEAGILVHSGPFDGLPA